MQYNLNYPVSFFVAASAYILLVNGLFTQTQKSSYRV